jgi:Tfp pilus assembly protein PilO
MKKDIIWFLVLVVVLFLSATTWYRKNEEIKSLKESNGLCSESLKSTKQELEDEKAVANRTKEQLIEVERKLANIKKEYTLSTTANTGFTTSASPARGR